MSDRPVRVPWTYRTIQRAVSNGSGSLWSDEEERVLVEAMTLGVSAGVLVEDHKRSPGALVGRIGRLLQQGRVSLDLHDRYVVDLQAVPVTSSPPLPAGLTIPVSRQTGRRVHCPRCFAPAGEQCRGRNGDLRVSNHVDRKEEFIRQWRDGRQVL